VKVLVIDSSEDVSVKLKKMISELPEVSRVEWSGDTLDAVTRLPESSPDVVVIDVSMPPVTGIDLIEKIKRDHPAIKIVVLTDSYYPMYQRECLGVGADYFLDKSNDFERLPDLLRQIKSS